ncbi:MAG: hypothetical protein LBQ91_04880 [Oscillospiraceae bacterium]|jgi:hypothetical protein|nr:hypothetical protein [Oscillospiraceae bacterium]
MKKAIAIITACLLLAATAGCVRNSIRKSATEVIAICDQFLDDQIDCGDAYKQVSRIVEKLDEKYDYEKLNDEEQTISISLSSLTLSLATANYNLHNYNGDRDISDQITSILRTRNYLAEDVGIKTRE